VICKNSDVCCAVVLCERLCSVAHHPAVSCVVCSINAVSDSGVPALNVLVTVYLCDGCSSHGQCEFDIAPPTNLSYRFQQVTCLCDNGYNGQ
jgi:hypothetical protein